MVKTFLPRNPQVRAEDFPGYAPELNPDELVWCRTTYSRMANCAAPDMRALREGVQAELTELKLHAYMLLNFIDHAGLKLSGQDVTIIGLVSVILIFKRVSL